MAEIKNIVRHIKICTDIDDQNNITWSQADIGANSNNIFLSKDVDTYTQGTNLTNILESLINRILTLEAQIPSSSENDQ